MHIRFNGRDREFVPWRPAAGPVFGGPFAFDCETTLIDDNRPWLAPAYVIGAACDGERGVFVTRPYLAAFFAAHPANTVVFHNAAFDLDVIATAAPETRLYDRVDANRVYDTQLMHRLLTLGELGHTSQGKGESTLERCAAVYLGTDLPKDVVDSAGDPVRLCYGKWLNRPPGDMEPVFLEYLAADAAATHGVFEAVRERTCDLLATAGGVWGYVSDGWLDDRSERFGPQTHHIHLKASIVLRAISSNGLHLDAARRDELAESLRALQLEQRAGLREYGYLPGGKGSNKSLQAVLQLRARQHPSLSFPLTEAGQFATAHDALHDLADADPFVKLLLEYRETEKLLGSFVGKMAKPVLHPSFNVLTRSGRTSSFGSRFGEINAQNLPKCDAVRACFVPRTGYEFIDADYATIELGTLAQACLTQFGLTSEMAAAINRGEDLHKLVAARMLGKSPGEVTKAERQKAKPVNFGKPGGMGNETLTVYAKVNYGARLDPEEAAALSESWLDQFPEMRAFLADGTDTPAELAELLDLTRESHFASTGDPRFVQRPRHAGREGEHCPFLAMMLLKVTRDPDPTTTAGEPYSGTDCDYLWSRLDTVAAQLPPAQRKAVSARRPSRALQRAVMGLVGRAPVFTLSGRLRANASYSARHNTIFQGLAADGAKLALWRLWRAGFRVVNFVHDQVLVEVPAGTPRDRMRHAQEVRRHLIDGMRELVPDVRVGVSYAATDRWYKDAEAVTDASGEGL
ncbi:dna-directed dna polymerase : Marine sediment metagenome DNA, contig: S01H1_L07108 (Fragment) OS=marine sediment metagenome GN=S01H1_16914 PE=4 SV=1: DNA_pol_A_exo1: DNA_pol_A [Gemmataceae bacterium]